MVEVSLEMDAPELGLRSVAVYITNAAGGVWQFGVHRNTKTNETVIKEPMFAVDANSCFAEPGAVPVPLELRLELARNFEQVAKILYA